MGVGGKLDIYIYIYIKSISWASLYIQGTAGFQKCSGLSASHGGYPIGSELEANCQQRF